MYSAPTGQAPFAQHYQNGHAAPQYPPTTGYTQPGFAPASAPVAYAPQPYQQPYAAPQQNGPPLKKQKGNPVITRYPPPPGYKGVPPYVAPPYAAQAHPASHQQPQPTYSQPAYQGYQPGPATVYPPAPVWPAQPIYDPNQAYQQAQYQPQPTQPYAHPPPLYAPQEPLGYYDVNGGFVPHNVPHSQPFTESIAHTSRPDEDDHVGSHTRHSSFDFGLDFEGEVGLTAEEIDENLSLGLIVWHPAVPTSKPLPCFSEAEAGWTESVKAAEGTHISVTSQFFPDDMSVDIRTSVRDTEEWQKVKDDLIFVEFGKTSAEVPLATVIANRARPDPDVEQLEPVPQHDSADSDQPQQAGASEDDAESDGDQAMDMSDDEDEPAPTKPFKPITKHAIPVHQTSEIAPLPPLRQVTILDSLERALGPKSPRKGDRQSSRASARHSRSRSPEKRSRQGSQQPKAKPSTLPKDVNQENILAQLGVEGSPKMVYPTPPPALGLPAPPGNRNKANTGGFGPPYHGFPYGPNLPPPPPPRESRSPSYDPWRSHDAATSPKSITSQHTAPGSDFHPDDEMRDWDATPRAKAHINIEREGSGRKRTYEEATAGESGRRRQDDDTPRARRRQQSRQDVYSRYDR